MRKILALALASTFLTAAPVAVVSTPVEAASLFDSLFPRAAKRRKERRRLRALRLRNLERDRVRFEQRLKKKKIVKKVKSPTFKNYAPAVLRTVALASLAKPFSAYDQKLLAADALLKAKPEPVGEGLQDGKEASLDANVILASQTTEIEEPVSQLAPIRLSAGAGLLKSIKVAAKRKLGKAVVAHYKASPEFLWMDGNGKMNQNAQAALRVLADADAYGLNSEDYALPLISYGDDASDEDILRAAMQFEFSLTTALLRYMADARNGVVNPNGISGYHDFKGLGADYKGELVKLSRTDDVSATLLAAHPKEPAFQQLKNQLEKLREAAAGYESVSIKSGTFIRPGQSNDQLENIVESIRRIANKDLRNAHFDVFAVSHAEGVYSEEVVAMVRDFQKSVKLKPDGIVGRNTIARMSGDDPKIQMNKVLYAMERLRWHPDRLGNTHVFINQPAYRATYMSGGKPKLSMRAVVGKPSNQTNFFHDKIEYVEYNPYWGIPRSILVNEYLPKLRSNAGYLDGRGYEITNTRGQRISSSNVNWYGVGADFPFNVRQPPGPRNALGELKIMFPNKHSIYMHDTPAKSLFKRQKRAFSHGCVRLADPRAMAAAVLGSNVSTIASQLADGKNKQQRLARKIPVYVAYFTAWPESDGTVKFFGDVYGRDKALSKAIAKERAVRQKARDV